ncbi:collagen-binding domain-containing protein [Arthrobacter sp. 3Tela_A]|uniref:collagen-binding domain-containing protein n=1 Tax=Arthrobacter sp. 3Tela_A TaxID=3093743 RepID=UPI003BB4C6A6
MKPLPPEGSTHLAPTRRRTGAVLASAGVMAALLAAPLAAGPWATGASAAGTGSFNPFEVNQGFTLYVSGDAVLGNGEMEGSIAVDGRISTANQNGYPLVHQVAGLADYTVPLIDGVPVRILAAEYTGAGSVDLTNRSAQPGSPEAGAGVKLVQTANLSGSARGGGNDGRDFLRVTNTDGGNLDLKPVPFHSGYATDLSLLATAEPSVGAYFPNRAAQLSRTSQCLASMYDPANGLAHTVPVKNDNSMVMPGPYATDKPNVLNYSDVAGKTIKGDNANGYRPTAEAPLVIKVPAGTTEVGRLNFEGWSSAGAGQALARYIFLDLSEVTGNVLVDGLEMGAVYAPSASVAFNSNVTHNGQWLTGSFNSAGAGELHHHTFLGELPCAASAPVVPTPEPSTTTPAEPTPEPSTTTPAEPTAEPSTTTPAEPTVEPSEPTVEPSEPTEPAAVVPSADPSGAPAAGGTDPGAPSASAADASSAPASVPGSVLAATGSAGALAIGAVAVLLLTAGLVLFFGGRKGRHA